MEASNHGSKKNLTHNSNLRSSSSNKLLGKLAPLDGTIFMYVSYVQLSCQQSILYIDVPNATLAMTGALSTTKSIQVMIDSKRTWGVRGWSNTLSPYFLFLFLFIILFIQLTYPFLLKTTNWHNKMTLFQYLLAQERSNRGGAKDQSRVREHCQPYLLGCRGSLENGLFILLLPYKIKYMYMTSYHYSLLL